MEAANNMIKIQALLFIVDTYIFGLKLKSAERMSLTM